MYKKVAYTYTDVLLMLCIGRFIVSIVVDPLENKLYYTDRGKRTVSVVKLATGKNTKIVKRTSGMACGLAVDRKAR